MIALMRLPFLLLPLVLVAAPAARAADRLIYPAPESAEDTRYSDLVEILSAVLERTTPGFGPATMEPSKAVMNEARYLNDLRDGAGVTIVWSSTSVEKERALLPVRIPLRKGILGYRVALVARDNLARIDQVRTLEDLRKLTIGQGIGWGDVELYNSNGLKVITANYENLFGMLDAGRFDLFPRGINEAFAEQAARTEEFPNLAIEPSLLIHYPWPYYFFFNKSDAALAGRVEAGLRMMMRDGSFDALFRKYNDAWIRRADLAHRRVIQIANPFLPPETPLDDPSLWFDPASY
jgi:Bacterial extracellular solute-binding proteins, family 3